jgi:hypothetical protein
MPFLLICLLGFFSQVNDRIVHSEKADVHQGLWCASLASPGGDLSFGLELYGTHTSLAATLVNGSERIDVPSARVDRGELVLDIAHYDATVRAKLSNDGDLMKGEWKKRSGVDRWTKLAFTAVLAKNGSCDATAPRAKDEPGVDGRWSAKFSSSEDLAVGVFQAKSTHAVEGTFLTTTGDYRFLAGVFQDKRLHLSCFDGTHAFLFDAKLEDDGTLKGDFWSGDRWHETWTATRDANAVLPETYGRAHWNEDFGLASVCFPDLDGKEHTLADPELAGKARIVQVLGSWCPNCHDETHFLAELDRKDRSRGLSIVGLAFEITGDFERDAEQVRRTAKRHGAAYPFLLAGTYGGDKTNQALPALGGLFAFPTTIFLHRDGRVRAIHSGFSGPGTGDEYTKLQGEFERIVDELIEEPDPDESSTWKLLLSDDWRDERDRVIVRMKRESPSQVTYQSFEALRYDRPAHVGAVAQGDVVLSGSSVRVGSDLYQLDRRAGVMLDARDVGHRLTPATRHVFPIVDGKSYFEPAAMLAAVKSEDALLRREAIVYATLSMQRHELETPFDPTPSLGDPDAGVRAAAAWSAGQLKIAASIPALVECTNHGNAALRREAARALGKIGAPDASRAKGASGASGPSEASAANGASSANEALRASVAAAATERLNALTHDYDPLVRDAAKDALAKIAKH